MNEWLKNFIAKLKEMWGKWKPLQKGILVGIVVIIIVAIVLMFRVSSTPTGVPLFQTPISDEKEQEAVLMQLEADNVKYRLNEQNLIIVENSRIASKEKENIYVNGVWPSRAEDPLSSIVNTSAWSETDFDRNIKLRNALQKQLEFKLENLNDVVEAKVAITEPEREFFAENQKPVTCSVELRFKNGSLLQSDKKRLKNIQNLILKSVSGLTAENLAMTDVDGNSLNDFESLAESDRLDNIKKETKMISDEEKKLEEKVLSSLQKNFNGADKVRSLNIKIEKNFNKVSRDQDIHTPILISEQDPSKPYDTTEKRDYLPLSSQTITKEWTGTGYNPQGPAGVEGQNPPVYSDMSNVIGKSTETAVTQNNVFNSEKRLTEQNSELVRITASANIDGTWETQTNSKRNPIIVTEDNINSLIESCRNQGIAEDCYRISLGKFFRIYKPVPKETIDAVTKIVQDAIGFVQYRDSVSITNFPIPREALWDAEEEEYFRKEQTRTTILLVLAGTALVLIVFIIFRFISRELERRRRLREEEILRRQQAEREKALWDAKQEGMEVTMSVEERKRAELQENAIAMAKEHPEDVAMLIRTWLMEE